MTALSRLASAVSARAEARPGLAAVLLMLAASLALASMHGSVRFVSAGLHPFEIAFFRNVFGFCVLIPWLARIGVAAFATRKLPLHLVRGVLNGGSMLMWFLGLSLIPLAEATALSLASPLIATAGAILFLGETWMPGTSPGMTEEMTRASRPPTFLGKPPSIRRCAATQGEEFLP